jgi:hypothetical protein
MNKLEFALQGQRGLRDNPEFFDLSLSSDSEIPVKDIEEWRAIKSKGSKSFSDSVGMLSTLLQSERKISIHSKPGSIVDSFVVSLPQNPLK